MSSLRDSIHFLTNGFSRPEEHRISFRFDYTYADIDPDADLGPLNPKNFTVIKYKVPEMAMGTVVVADATNRDWPLLWTDAGARYGNDIIERDSVDLSTLGYVRVCRNRKGTDGLFALGNVGALEREFIVLEDVCALPPKDTVSFLVRPKTGEAYCEHFGNWNGEILSRWYKYGAPYGCMYLRYGKAKKESYVLSGWMPQYYSISREGIVNFAKTHHS